MPILEEILEPCTGDSQTPDAPSNMAIIKGSSNFTIAGSHLSNVVGPQNNTIYHGNINVQQVNRDYKERQLTLWDEFTRVPTGQLYITKTWCTADVKDPDHSRWKKRGRRDIDAKRTINTARIGNSEYLHIGYSGVDAAEVYGRDFERFSRTRHANSVQLFGYTSRAGIPALIFYDELIPVSFIWEKHGFSSLMYTYFSYLARERADTALPLCKMWIDPRTGWLRKGPSVRSSASGNVIAAWFPPDSFSMASDNQRSLTLKEYKNIDVLQKYLFEFLSIHGIVRGVLLSAKYRSKWGNDEDTISVLSSLAGTIYNRTSLEPIVRWSGYREKCQYLLRKSVPEIAQECTVMEDGSVRLTFALADMQDLPKFWLQYVIRPLEECIDFMETWLSLAHNIFHQPGIPRDVWEDYSILNDFWLCCECKQRESLQGPINIPFDTPVHLFIHPIPRPSDDESTWNAWMKGRKYSWSFDPFGKEEISDAENERRELGPPSLEILTAFGYQSWTLEAYETIQALHTKQGFDPISTALARSLGLPYHELEIINPESGRFEYINDGEDWTDDEQSTTYSDDTEYWSTDSDNSIQASTLLQDQDSMDVDEPSVPSTFEDLDSMKVDVQLSDAMDIDQDGGWGHHTVASQGIQEVEMLSISTDPSHFITF